MAPNYDKSAIKAKKEFARRLRAAMKRGGISQVQIANSLGVSSTVVSQALSEPERKISEHLIRMVALYVPGMETCYRDFRQAVDGPFLPAPEGGELENSTLDKLDRLEKITEDMAEQFVSIISEIRGSV